MEGTNRFAYNDVFDLDLDQIKSVGHSLVAIQSRVNDTVSKFNETMDDTDGLGDLRMLNASKNRTNINKILVQQERRAREQQKLAAALARPEDHDMTDSDDEWNIEEKKIMLGMESSSHVADEGYRSVEKLIERISGVQNGAANRLSSLILEIDAIYVHR